MTVIRDCQKVRRRLHILHLKYAWEIQLIAFGLTSKTVYEKKQDLNFYYSVIISTSITHNSWVYMETFCKILIEIIPFEDFKSTVYM